MSAPSVSIVVPVAGGLSDTRETLASLESQGHGSLQVVVEAREPLRDALVAGFARASGDVLAFLRPGETLLPGALREAVTRLERGTAVMGRCALTLPGSMEPVLEHPSEYRGLFDHLAIWKSGWDRAARPSLFWTRAAHRSMGDFIDASPGAIDYDLVCRLGRQGIRTVDAVWAVRPMPAVFPPEVEELDELVRVSRSHWGSWLAPLRWRCGVSYWLHVHRWHDRARHHARLAEAAAARGNVALARIERFKTALYSPAMARGRFGIAYRRLLDRKS